MSTSLGRKQRLRRSGHALPQQAQRRATDRTSLVKTPSLRGALRHRLSLRGFTGERDFWKAAMHKRRPLLALGTLVVTFSISIPFLTRVETSAAHARDAKRLQDIRLLRTALRSYVETYGVPKRVQDGLRLCLGYGDGRRCWWGTQTGSALVDQRLREFIREIPEDPGDPRADCAGTAYMLYTDPSHPGQLGLHWGVEGGPPHNSYCGPGITSGSWEDPCYRTACVLWLSPST